MRNTSESGTMLALTPSDAALVRKTLAGHPEAFEALVLRNIRKAHAVARAAGLRDDAVEDAVQDGFLRAFRDLHSLKDAASFGPWLLAIVRNAARKQLARRRDLPAVAAAAEGQAAPADDLEGKDFREHLWSRVAELPGDVREAIYLYYHEGESIRSVARALAITVSGAKKRLRRGKDILRERLWRELAECLRDMLPSTREWRRRAGKLSLLAAASLPTAWAARVRAQPLEPAGTSSSAGAGAAPASLIGTLALGGFVVSVKKIVTAAAIVLVCLGGAAYVGFQSPASRQRAPVARVAAPGAAAPVRQPEEAVVPAVESGPAPGAGTGAAAPGSGRIVVLVADQEGAPIEGARIACMVYRDGASIEGAEVARPGPGTAAAKSGPDGAASLDGLPPGHYALDIAADGFGRERLVEVQVTPEFAEARVEIALTPACSIHGRVRDRFGKPVEGCELTVYLRSPYGPSHEASWWRSFKDTGRSDAAGELRMQALPFGAYAVEARKDGFSTRVGRLAPNLYLGADELSFDAGRLLEVLVLVHEGRWIEGTVTCRGLPVEGAKIHMDLEAEDPELEELFFRGLQTPNWGWTAPGAYEIRDCIPGTHEVEIRAPGMARLLATLEVPENPRDGGGGPLRKDFELEPGGSIRGWLVRHGRVAPGWVHLFRRTAPEEVEFKGSVRAAPDGLFSFPDRLEDGSYLLCGFAAGHPAGAYGGHEKRVKTRALPGEVEAPVEDGAGPQELIVESVPGDCVVSGRVHDRAGRPVPGASLNLRYDASGLQTYGAPKASDTGEFAFAGLPPGRLELQVDASGFATAHAEAIFRKPGEDARLEVVLEKARRFRAELVYVDGEPDSDPEVVLERKTEQGWRHQHGGRPGVGLEGGIFEVKNLPPAIYRVSANFREHAELVTSDFDLRGEESADVVLRAEAGVAVSGRIVFDDPAFEKGRVLAHLHYTDGVRAVKAVKIEGGAYRIEHLRRGELADLALQWGPEADPVLSEPLPGFRVDRDENAADLGPVRERRGEK